MKSCEVKSVSLDYELQEVKANSYFTHRLNFWKQTRLTLPRSGLSDLREKAVIKYNPPCESQQK